MDTGELTGEALAKHHQNNYDILNSQIKKQHVQIEHLEGITYDEEQLKEEGKYILIEDITGVKRAISPHNKLFINLIVPMIFGMDNKAILTFRKIWMKYIPNKKLTASNIEEVLENKLKGEK